MIGIGRAPTIAASRPVTSFWPDLPGFLLPNTRIGLTFAYILGIYSLCLTNEQPRSNLSACFTLAHPSHNSISRLDRAMADTIALIVAAGRGERAQQGECAYPSASTGATPPKQYRLLAGKPVLRWAAEAFLAHPSVSEVQVVIRAEDRMAYESATAGLRLHAPGMGGATRQESVRHRLEALAA